MLSMKQLAEICGYSRVTVSAALHGKAGVSDKVRDEILRIAEENNYTPNKMASSLKGEKSFLIGMLVRDITNPFYTQMIKVIDEVVSAAGYSLLLLNTNEDPARETKAVKTFYSYYIDGLLLAPFMHKDNSYKLLDNFIEKKVPVIMLDRLSDDSKLGYIGFNNFQGAYDATQHLYDQGHRNVTYLAGPSISISSRERGDGYWNCLAEQNIPLDQRHIVSCGSSSEDGYKTALNLLKDEATRPSALLCFNDLVAIGVYRAAQELHLRIPEDISIIGFDNIDLTGILAPPLTSVSLNIDHVAKEAAENLLNCIENKISPTSFQKIYEPELIKRKSVARYNKNTS